MLAWYTYDISTLLLISLLVTASVYDIRSHRIPNWLVLSGCIAGIALHTYFLGLPGFAASLAGLLMGGGVLLPFYLIKVQQHRLMGAADVKLMAAVGAFLGPLATLLAVALTLAVGTVAGLAYLFCHGALASYLHRNWLVLKTLFISGRWLYQAPDSNDVAMRRFPYALAIAGGTLSTLAYLSYLSFYHLHNLLQGMLLQEMLPQGIAL